MPRPLKTAYTTLNSIIQRLNADSNSINVSTVAAQNTQIATESANFQAEMKACIYKASDLITAAMNNVFVPYSMTHTWRYQEWRNSYVYDRQLAAHIMRLPDSLLSVTSYTWTGTAVSGSEYYLRPEGAYPAREIAIYGDVSFTRPTANTESAALAGLWGYHPDPANMWIVSGGTVSDNPLSSSATTVNVSSGALFQTLQYIRIDSEYMLITSITNNALTVERGVNGTTAASHLASTAIYTYAPVTDIADECARLAIRRYQLRSGIEVVATGETAFELKMGDVNLSPAYKQYYIGSG